MTHRPLKGAVRCEGLRKKETSNAQILFNLHKEERLNKERERLI